MFYLALVPISDLSFNSITRLQVENFHGLELLVELNLSHNKIDSMTSEVFHHLSVRITFTTTSTFEKIFVSIVSSINIFTSFSLSLLANAEPETTEFSRQRHSGLGTACFLSFEQIEIFGFE